MVLLVYILYHIIDGVLQDAHLAAQYTVQVRTPLTDPNSRTIPHVADGRSWDFAMCLFQKQAKANRSQDLNLSQDPAIAPRLRKLWGTLTQAERQRQGVEFLLYFDKSMFIFDS